jgi:hypothetical protein
MTLKVSSKIVDRAKSRDFIKQFDHFKLPKTMIN